MAAERHINWDSIKPHVEAKNYPVALKMIDHQLSIKPSPFLEVVKANILEQLEKTDAGNKILRGS